MMFPSLVNIMHLTHDEIVAFAFGGVGQEFRVRVWMAKDTAPVVLLEQRPGFSPPSWFPARIANLVTRDYLPAGSAPSWFAASRNKQWFVCRLLMTTVGRPPRLTYHDASAKPSSLPVLESIVGETVKLG